jgi:presqualene diphosphate synthase
MTQEDIDFVTASVKQAGTSFYHGMRILPPARRDAMYGIYAFCRAVDDIADEDGDFAAKRVALDEWRGKIADLFLGATHDAITRVLCHAVQTYDLRREDFLAVIDGMEMDAGDPIIAPDLAELDLYCDRVASAVGRLSVRVFGDAGQAAQETAYALGRALQLTNILRDVGEDAAHGRIYLPREYLDDAGIAPVPATLLAAPTLPQLCARLADMAEGYFAQAEAAMARSDRTAMRPAGMMAASYKPLLTRLRAQNFDYQNGRVSLPKWRKLALAARLLLSR